MIEYRSFAENGKGLSTAKEFSELLKEFSVDELNDVLSSYAREFARVGKGVSMAGDRGEQLKIRETLILNELATR